MAAPKGAAIRLLGAAGCGVRVLQTERRRGFEPPRFHHHKGSHDLKQLVIYPRNDAGTSVVRHETVDGKRACKKPRVAATPPGHSPGAEERFEQAKNPAGTPQFVPIVAKPTRAEPEPKLTRVAFRVSRLMEFCSERELQNQTGHGAYEWPTVIAKELIDNALDACEEAEVAPEIAIAVAKAAIVVQDNAGGIGAETIESVLDYSVRVSSREAYVSPTRGAQGNALKTILAMGYVLDRENGGDGAGVTIIEARGVEHRIEFRVDHVNNQPRIVHTTAPSAVEVGTRFTVRWPQPRLLEYAADQVKRLVRAYVWFNPHLSVRGTWLLA
jgi:hypothetical protein